MVRSCPIIIDVVLDCWTGGGVVVEWLQVAVTRGGVGLDPGLRGGVYAISGCIVGFCSVGDLQGYGTECSSLFRRSGLEDEMEVGLVLC